jgi:methionyl-tRNA formyltransferase
MACRAFQTSALRIAYVGLPLGALALAAAGFTPCCVCLGHPDAPGARRLRRRLPPGTLLLGKPDLAAPSVQSALASARPEVLLSWFWPTRVPDAVLALAPRGAFGVHPSLLPRWRGPDPYFWAIFSGDHETGVTLHRLAAEYDTGAVVEQVRLPMRAGENAWALARRLDRPGLRLLVRAAQALDAGEVLTGSPQREVDASSAPAPSEALLSIDWQQDAHAITRLVRAAAPYPGALAELGGEVIEILAAEAVDVALPQALQPADAVLAGGRVVVRAGIGAVALDRVRTEDQRVLRGDRIATLFPRGIATI